MNIYLAGTSSKPHCPVHESSYVLESFYYFDQWQVELLGIWKSFMLDSGAFTFMSNSRQSAINWDEYVERYAEFINKHDIKLFFELDIDKLVGLAEVERLRKKLEKLTGKQCIPVWHRSRGKEYFLSICGEYRYIGMGGFAIKDITPSEYQHIRWFIQTAHQHQCKVHGLGFTSMRHLPTLHFDSVDSTSWNNGSRFGALHLFKNGIIKIYQKPQGTRSKDYIKLDRHNFSEWVKFQKYAENNL